METHATTALVIHPDGTLADISLHPGDDYLHTLYSEIGCQTVDLVALTSALDMWVDDEGIYQQPVNPIATALARRYGFTWQAYHGPAVLCGHDGPATIGLTHSQLRTLLTQLDDIIS
ncbi:DUF3846 domain-containing protein [Mycobacterium simiae]|uniref:DUF3846 domain-containing protein n=1 Tax=Mycobacterium simiae TaxID=1784 RepID=UPI00165FCDC4|nr:DUF3846 domain-containing protein [Mycobacterium simiae]